MSYLSQLQEALRAPTPFGAALSRVGQSALEYSAADLAQRQQEGLRRRQEAERQRQLSQQQAQFIESRLPGMRASGQFEQMAKLLPAYRSAVKGAYGIDIPGGDVVGAPIYGPRMTVPAATPPISPDLAPIQYGRGPGLPTERVDIPPREIGRDFSGAMTRRALDERFMLGPERQPEQKLIVAGGAIYDPIEKKWLTPPTQLTAEQKLEAQMSGGGYVSSYDPGSGMATLVRRAPGVQYTPRPQAPGFIEDYDPATGGVTLRPRAEGLTVTPKPPMTISYEGAGGTGIVKPKVPGATITPKQAAQQKIKTKAVNDAVVNIISTLQGGNAFAPQPFISEYNELPDKTPAIKVRVNTAIQPISFVRQQFLNRNFQVQDLPTGEFIAIATPGTIAGPKGPKPTPAPKLTTVTTPEGKFRREDVPGLQVAGPATPAPTRRPSARDIQVEVEMRAAAEYNSMLNNPQMWTGREAERALQSQRYLRYLSNPRMAPKPAELVQFEQDIFTRIMQERQPQAAPVAAPSATPMAVPSISATPVQDTGESWKDYQKPRRGGR